MGKEKKFKKSPIVCQIFFFSSPRLDPGRPVGGGGEAGVPQQVHQLLLPLPGEGRPARVEPPDRVSPDRVQRVGLVRPRGGDEGGAVGGPQPVDLVQLRKTKQKCFKVLQKN